MGKPAARAGDMTAHGGVITMGCPTVLIGGMPAARVGDMHLCPMLNPGTPPPPHVGGPVTLGSPMVLIGGMPAARMGDLATCAGPPDTIIGGCPTVLIGGGGGGAGGGGGGAVTAAQAGAAAVIAGEPGPETEGPHWIEYQFRDSAGNPVTGVTYAFEDVDGRRETGTLTGDGAVRRGGLPHTGDCRVRLLAVSNARWSQEEARVGDRVRLQTDVLGYEEGTAGIFEIFERDMQGPDRLVDRFEAAVRNGKLEAEWTYRMRREETAISSQRAPNRYSYPEYYFVAAIGSNRAKSGLLIYQSWIEIELVDEEGAPVPNEEYILRLSNGEVRTGRLGQDGKAREENLPPVAHRVEFPNLERIEPAGE